MRPRDFLAAMGTADIPHGSRIDSAGNSTGSFMDHLMGAEDKMREWGFDDALCHAALFHSVYGTEGFQGFTLDVSERDRVREIIGERAEQIAFLNCVMDRHSLDTLAAAAAAGRDTGQGSSPIVLQVRPNSPVANSGADETTYELSERDLVDLMTVHLADHLEGFEHQMNRPDKNWIAHDVEGQRGHWEIPPRGWFGYRREAYSAMARAVGGVAEASWKAALATVPLGCEPARWVPAPVPIGGASKL